MVIREAQTADLPQMVALWDEFMAFHEDLDPVWVRREGATDTWREYIGGVMTAQDSVVLVAEKAGRLVGQCVAKVMEPPPVFTIEKHGFIQEIVVTAEQRGQGVGRALYTRAERWLAQQGMTHLRTNIDTGNELSKGLFRAMGYGPLTVTWQKRLDEE